MEDLPLLSLTIFLPLLGAFVLLLMRDQGEVTANNARAVALLTSGATFIISLIAFYFFDSASGDFQLIERYAWIPAINCYYHIGVDGISMLFILLSTFLTPIAILSSVGAIKKRVKEYMLVFLLLETMMVGMFCALDFVLFYLFFEGVLIPMFLIIGIWGGTRRIYASFKFFLYTFLGSVLMLVAIMVIYFQTGTTGIEAAWEHSFSFQYQFWLWLAFFASFAVKVPMWPVHTWLPDAHVEAPTAGSVILAAVLLKMGGYGFLRFSLPVFPEASVYFANMMFGLSVIAVIYTSLIALVQKDMKKLIAYSSIAHMGFVTFGTFTFSLQGLQGAMFQMLSHGLVSGALFLAVGVVYDRLHTREIDRFGGLVNNMPLYAVSFLIFTFASVGLPGTSGFVGEILILISAFSISGWWAFGIGLGVILGAAYMLILYRRVIFGPLEKEDLKKLTDLTFNEKVIFAPLIVLIILFGVYPTPLLKVTEASMLKITAIYEKNQREARNQQNNTTQEQNSDVVYVIDFEGDLG